MSKVYISAPIAGYDLEERKQFFNHMENRVKEVGHEPVNPMKNGIEDSAHWREHMKADIALLVDCDMILLCENWHLSKGCKLEFDVATSCGIEIFNANFSSNVIF